MKTNMKVSVIIPVYNSEKHIREALDSVLNQTYKNIEIIVVDDGSSDHTPEVIRTHYPMIRYMGQKNGGAAKARNLGIREASGEWIAFLDSDDIWLPTKVEQQVEYFKNHPDVGFIFTDHINFHENGLQEPPTQKREFLLSGDPVMTIFKNGKVNTSTVMMRREVIPKVGYFDETLRVAEDTDLWMRVAMQCRIDVMDQPLAKRRSRPDSLSSGAEALWRGVQGHIEKIREKQPAIAVRLGQALLDETYRRACVNLGDHYFRHNQFQKARLEYKKSLHHGAGSRRVFCYLFLSYWPVRWVEGLRHIRHTLRAPLTDAR
jgi:glycosyltransferase involved in cell wall biosynthesis